MNKQILGLNKRALDLVTQTLPQCEEIITQHFEDGTVSVNTRVVTQSVITKKVYAAYKGPLGLEIPLFQYILRGGQIVHESIQDTPWDEGPRIFLALQTSSNEWIKETLWTTLEIQKVMGWSASSQDFSAESHS